MRLKKNKNVDILEEKKKIIKAKKEKNDRQIIILEYLILIIIITMQFLLSYMLDKKIALENERKRQETIYNEIISKYNTYVKAVNDTKLYKLKNDKYIEIGSVSKDTEIVLQKKEIKNYEDVYFKLANLDYYIKYNDVEKIENITIDNRYTNYLPFNQNVVSKSPTMLYSDSGYSYTINEEINKPIIIKETDRYYIEYDKKLLYIKSSDIKEIITSSNTTSEETSGIAVLLYHYVYPEELKKDCTNTIICHSIPQVRSHFDYLKANNYYTVSMKDLDLWIDGKIRLPKNSVTITIDDGWFVNDMKILLEEYGFHGTLFLITSLVPASAYESKNLEIHSHTDNMHYTGKCPGGQGSPIKCLDRNAILTDLKLSREKLNNTTYFSWPFYEYNDYSMNLLKEAGFTMAFKGGTTKATRGVNKYLIPRITMHNSTTIAQLANYIK